MPECVVAAPQMGSGPFRWYMKSKYERSLREAGARLVWIGIGDPGRAVEEALACGGLLLPGGADLDPALYGRTASDKCGSPDLARDVAEPLLLRAFLKAGKPVLGICRGAQLINAVLGGTIVQDIKKTPGARHMDFLRRAGGSHGVTVRRGSRLGGILGAERITVNSMHHQAVELVGKGLRVDAVSDDGVVEGVELAGCQFCIGVQWHPEHMARTNLTQRKIFDAFVRACQ